MGRNGLTRYMTPSERFRKQFEFSPDSTCWIWIGSSNGRYGFFMVDGKSIVAHKWAYEQFHGKVPEGLQVDHVCGTTLCVNVAHLRAVTPSENVRAHWREQRGTCRNGHETNDDNTVWRLGGKTRLCRICDRARRARYRANKKEA